MAQKTNGGMTTARKLDTASNLHPWESAAKSFLDGATAIGCPLCRKGELKITAVSGPDHIGFLLFTCPVCGKSANFSRIKFPESIPTKTF